MDKVFLTGHRGYLGKRIAQDLSKDYEVIGFDFKANIRDNICNFKSVITKMTNCKYVVHTAGIPHPDKGSFTDYFNTNVIGSFNVMSAAAKLRVYRVIYLSSGAYYGWDVRGKLYPLYFPIDENHPITTTTMRFEGQLDEYNQSKVMAEQILAYYGTNEYFQAIALRLAPARPKAKFFPFTEKNPEYYRLRTFWTNVEPETVVHAVRCAIETQGDFKYEAFNIAERYTHKDVDLEKYLIEHYPGIPVKEGWQPPQNLMSIKKAEEMLGFKPSEARE